MLGILARRGFSITDDEREADVIIVNTCCFIGDAKEESIRTILDMARWKEEGCCRALVVCGCLAERYRDEVLAEMPEVDAVVGTAAYDEIASVLDSVLEKHEPETYFRDVNLTPAPAGRRLITTGGHFAFLKIAEGCDKHCTYCVIPSVRGRYRSVPMEELTAQAADLAAQGVRELILVAQETTLYGTDLCGRKMLPELLRKLCAIDGLVWIRILYCYPEEITDELIEVIRTEDKVCSYLDIPIQHASDAVLRRMGRKTVRRELEERIAVLRREVPGIALRTTLISGFPGETEEDHQILLDFVRRMKFDRLGVFAYPQEENPPAALLPDQVPEELREKRRDEIMAIQQKIAFAGSRRMAGRDLMVLIEGKMPEDDVFIGRTYRDAPDVDGFIFVKAGRELMTGDFVRVHVTGSSDYDLIGELDDELAE